MRVLVTGGTGYVGSHTVAALVEAGHEVSLLVRATQRVAPAVAPLGLQAADLATIVGDVTDPAAVEQAVRAVRRWCTPARCSPWTAATPAASAR
jgi:dihydroflavonol-4-reductase